MTEPTLRRQDDRLLSGLDKRLALVEQARELDRQARDAHFSSLEHAITALTSKIDLALDTMARQSAELSASPAGRRVLSDLAELQSTVERHDDFVAEMTGALRLAKFALGTSFLSVTGNVVMWLAVAGRQ